MTKRSMAAIAAATLGLTVLGGGAASASTDTTPVQWAQRMAQRAGLGDGPGFGANVGDAPGTGDPTTCPYYDGTTDPLQDRTRDRLMDPDADHDAVQQQTRDRIHMDLDD